MREISGGDSIALLRHNVPDLVDLPKEKVAVIETHYGPRAFHQLMATRPGDVAAIPATKDNYRKMLPLLSWGKRNLGVDYVVTSPSIDMAPFDVDDSTVVVPYFSAPNFGDLPMWGLDPEVALRLKNKISFANEMQSLDQSLLPVSERHDMHPTVVLPYETVNDTHEIRGVLSRSLDASSSMYSHFAQFDESVAEYPLGVVVQQAGGDGGYGTVIMREGTDGGWEILAEKDIKVFSTRAEAEDVLATLVEGSGGQYKVTRYVDVMASPSVGVYVNGPDVMALPLTIQFLEYGSCIGGASQNSVDAEDFAKTKEKEHYMQDLAGEIVGNILHGDTDSAHVGIDFMIAGEKEMRLISLIKEHPELAIYARDCIEVGIAECNPRMTSLSLSVWPLLLYDNRMSGRNRDDITYDDIGAFYGRPNARGETGGFAVWDFIDAPEGVSTEQELIVWLDRVNTTMGEQGIFLVPRLPLEEKGGKMITSVVLGMRPNASPESAEEFKRVVSELGSACSLEPLSRIQ